MRFPKFVKIILGLVLVPVLLIGILIGIYFGLQCIVQGIQYIASSAKNHIEIGYEGGSCLGQSSHKRVYFPLGSNYVSFGSLYCGGLDSITIQVLSKSVVQKLIRAIDQSRNSKIDYAYLGLTPEKVNKHWLTGGFDEYCAIARAYKLEPDYSALPKIMEMPHEKDHYGYSAHYIKITKPSPIKITLQLRMPWTIDAYNCSWNTYDQNVGNALALLLFQNGKALDEVWSIDKTKQWKVDEQRIWDNLQILAVKKHAYEIVSKGAPLPPNSLLYLAQASTSDCFGFDAILKFLKQHSIIDEVHTTIGSYQRKLFPHWELVIKNSLFCENVAESISWLKTWKKIKNHPAIQIDFRYRVYAIEKNWRKFGLDCRPDCQFQFKYKGQYRGYLLASKAGNKVYCWMEPVPQTMNKAGVLGRKIARNEFLLSKNDPLPKDLANRFQGN